MATHFKALMATLLGRLIAIGLGVRHIAMDNLKMMLETLAAAWFALWTLRILWQWSQE